MTDSHCHLDFSAFDKNRTEVVHEALRAGVHTIINIGAEMESSRRGVALTRQFDSVYATVGIHPHDATNLTDLVVDELRDLALQPKVVAIGEIGLDYYRDLSPRPVQRQAFVRQLQLAVELQLPIVIHTRDSFDDTFAIARDFAHQLPGGVFHCFPGTIEDAERVFELGFVISVGGVITYPKSSMSVMVSNAPLDKVMLETDSPYLTPVPFRGKQNQPAYIKYVCHKLAELQGITVEEVASTTDEVARRLYQLDETFSG